VSQKSASVKKETHVVLVGEHIDASAAVLSDADLPVHAKSAVAEEFLLKLLAAHFLFIKLRGPKLKRLVAAMSKTDVETVRRAPRPPPLTLTHGLDSTRPPPLSPALGHPAHRAQGDVVVREGESTDSFFVIDRCVSFLVL
jgi:hypothetical protein